jgi:hypothetical protein
MGTWNTSVTGNDTAKDLYIEYTAAFCFLLIVEKVTILCYNKR